MRNLGTRGSRDNFLIIRNDEAMKCENKKIVLNNEGMAVGQLLKSFKTRAQSHSVL